MKAFCHLTWKGNIPSGERVAHPCGDPKPALTPQRSATKERVTLLSMLRRSDHTENPHNSLRTTQ